MYNFQQVQDQLAVQQRCLLDKFKEISDKIRHHDSLVYDRDEAAKSLSKKKESPVIKQMNEEIQKVLGEIHLLTATALDRIIMVDCQADLAPIYRDPIEENHRYIVQASRSLSSILTPYDGQQQQLTFDD